MKKINWKQNKGISTVDIVVAMIILTLFVGVIGSLYYQIAYHNAAIRMNAMAVNYAVKIAENIDKITYEEVEETLNETLKIDFEIKEAFNPTIKVENYNEEDLSKEDIIKKVTIKIDYNVMDESRSYEIIKLKIKEI